MHVLFLETYKSDEIIVKKTIERLKDELRSRLVKVITTQTVNDARIIVATNQLVDCLVLIKTLTPITTDKDEPAVDPEADLIDRLHQRQPNVPVFLIADKGKVYDLLSLRLASMVNEFMWLLEDSFEFVIGRIMFAVQRYKNSVRPPLISKMKEYFQTFENSWVIPGHQGGVGFKKNPVGRAFFNFYGENLFQTDLNSARAEIGSLLEHSGSFKDSEANIARIFGADHSFTGVVGGSGSNRSVMQFCIQDGQTAAVDRNCHKSIAQGLILTGAEPVYVKPLRNAHGIIGPVGLAQLTAALTSNPAYAVLTNCTFDGVCYNSAKVEMAMDSVPYLHLDEAWFAYARFNPLYRNLYAMRDKIDRTANPHPAIFVTHSTHKMLNALSMGSFIHIRNGHERRIDHDKFNQAYMMHTSTSPSYPIAASNEVAAQQMDGPTGLSLTREVIDEAIDFRQTLARLYNRFTKDGDWFFQPWNIAKAKDGTPFENLPADELATKQEYWWMQPGDDWHGFGELTDRDYAMLDPIKVSIVMPGMDVNGVFDKSGFGVPATLVNTWLVHIGIVPTRFCDFQILFLFTMGITKGKWATLLEGLYAFKRHYDANTPVKVMLPELSATTDRYENMGIRDLGLQMVKFLKDKNLPKLLNDAFENLPERAKNADGSLMTPRQGYEGLIRDSEPVKLSKLADRTAATLVLPYPPGIPMLICGEVFSKNKDGQYPHIEYLSALQEWDKKYPGFGHDTTGVEVDANGDYEILCIVDKK